MGVTLDLTAPADLAPCLKADVGVTAPADLYP